ncbi:unnamed protein product [Amoebophrya sp. A25]|nr:unnamed protein product [Amoebophrya sp. A25]|eukprot:GSA25T00018605001.1
MGLKVGDILLMCCYGRVSLIPTWAGESPEAAIIRKIQILESRRARVDESHRSRFCVGQRKANTSRKGFFSKATIARI